MSSALPRCCCWSCSVMSCHVWTHLACQCFALTDGDTWWHTHDFPCTQSRFHCHPGLYWLACAEGWWYWQGDWRQQPLSFPLSLSVSLSRKLTCKPVTRSVFRCERRDAGSSLWAHHEQARFLAAHPPACYLGRLVNNTERQREVCLHHGLQLIFSLNCRHSDNGKREEKFLNENMLQPRSDPQISQVSDGETSRFNSKSVGLQIRLYFCDWIFKIQRWCGLFWM